MGKHLDRPQAVNAALQALGIDNLLLGIHDAAFPALAEEDTGRGSPYSEGAAGFIEFIRSLGFNGLQLGPQGITAETNSSPYDGSLFSRNPLSLAPLRLSRSGPKLLPPGSPAEFGNRSATESSRVDPVAAARIGRTISAAVCTQFRRLRQGRNSPKPSPLLHSYAAFRRANAAWLERDALYEVLRRHYGGKDWQEWRTPASARLDTLLFAPPPGSSQAARRRIGELCRRHRKAIEDYCFIQYLLAAQHGELRELCRKLELKLFGDCQIGLAGRDAWYAQGFMLNDYLLGAPPSRTTPGGQSWHYPVFDPRRYYDEAPDGSRQPGPVIRFLRERITKLFSEFDGLRIDHPHGLVCPWVYRADGDPAHAVRSGARLFASPDLADHPALAEFAIVRPEQIDRRLSRYDDNWVNDLDPGQVRRYGSLFEVIMEAARQSPHRAETACEILSTQPYPIKRVMELYRLGRFRVTQKADLYDPGDVYRAENAGAQDWLMLGNHDTPSIWQLAGKWLETGAAAEQAAYLADRLRIPAAERPAWIRELRTDPGALAQAKFADLFGGPGRNIMVFFTDLLGIEDVYNRPGTVNRENWSLRIAPDYRRIYREKTARRRALDIPKGLAMALRARDRSGQGEHRQLIAALENEKS